MSYTPRPGEPSGDTFTVTVMLSNGQDVYTWEGYADLPGDALSRAASAYEEQRTELYPDDRTYDQLRPPGASPLPGKLGNLTPDQLRAAAYGADTKDQP